MLEKGKNFAQADVETHNLFPVSQLWITVENIMSALDVYFLVDLLYSKGIFCIQEIGVCFPHMTMHGIWGEWV